MDRDERSVDTKEFYLPHCLESDDCLQHGASWVTLSCWLKARWWGVQSEIFRPFQDPTLRWTMLPDTIKTIVLSALIVLIALTLFGLVIFYCCVQLCQAFYRRRRRRAPHYYQRANRQYPRHSPLHYPHMNGHARVYYDNDRNQWSMQLMDFYIRLILTCRFLMIRQTLMILFLTFILIMFLLGSYLNLKNTTLINYNMK